MKPHTSVTVALCGVGLDTYWPQFAGLQTRLLGYQARIADGLRQVGATVIDAGLVDNPARAREIADTLAAQRPDLLFLNLATYALSATILPLAQRLQIPVVVLNLQPEAQMNYAAFNARTDRGEMTGEWLAYCQSCSAPETASVFKRAGIPFHLVSGYLDDPIAWREISDWVAAARVVRGMRNNQVGVLGRYYDGMLDVYSDLTQQAAVFGNHFAILEMDELVALREAVSPADVAAKRAVFARTFTVSPECSAAELDRAAATSCALDALVARHELGSLAYYFEGQDGTPGRNVVTSIIAGNTLLTANHIPVAGEYEVKNVQAMKILDLLGAGGSFAEFYLSDFVDDVVFLGHDGPAHLGIAEGTVGLVPLSVYHGKPGNGLSIQMTVAHGPVTVLSVVQERDGKLSLLVAEGESVPGPVLQIGNTNSRYRFSIGARGFMNAWSSAGPAHHCAIGRGHHAEAIKNVAKFLGVNYCRIC